MNYQEIHKSLFNQDESPSEREKSDKQSRQRYRKKDEDFSSMRYECFCDQQYFSYCSFYQHIKKVHDGFLENNKHFSYNNIVQTFDPDYGFKIKKLYRQKIVDKLREQDNLHKKMLESRVTVNNILKPTAIRSQVGGFSLKNKFKEFSQYKSHQNGLKIQHDDEGVYYNHGQKQSLHNGIGLLDLRQLRQMKYGNEQAKKKMLQDITTEFVKIIRYYKELLEIINMKELISKFGYIKQRQIKSKDSQLCIRIFPRDNKIVSIFELTYILDQALPKCNRRLDEWTRSEFLTEYQSILQLLSIK